MSVVVRNTPRADKDVVYEDFMHVINQLQGEGFFKVGLISEEVT